MLNRRNAIISLMVILILLSVTMIAYNLIKDTDEQELADNPDNGEADEQSLILPVYYVKVTDDNEYLVREEHRAPYTEDSFMAALNELIKGTPTTAGAMRVLPEDTRIHNISVKNGEVTVDFSEEVLNANAGAFIEELGIMSIVNTLTEFSDIDKVSFLVDGNNDERTMSWWGHVGLYEQPFQRDLSMVYEPAIWVRQPSPGQRVASPLLISGSAMVFEGTVCVRLLDGSDDVLINGFTNVTHGSPGQESLRGDFSISLDFTASKSNGKLEVFWESAKDGSEQDKVIVPVILNNPKK